MKTLPLLTGLLLGSATLSAQVMPDTFQRITSTATPGVSYDVGVAGSDGSFSIVKTGAGQRLTIDASGNVTVQNNLTVNGTFSASNFAGGAVTGGATGLTLNAGGTNQNITLSPSGSGRTIISGLGLASSNQEMLSIVTNYGSNSAQKAITWRDNANITAQIDTRYDGSSVDMVFGHLYNSGYQTSDLLTIKGSGNVGIGTATPSVKLDVAGAAKAQSLALTATTASTSTTTGALTVAGGAGIAGDVVVGGTLGIGLGASAPGATLDVGTDIRVRRDLYVDGVIHVASGNVQAATTTDAINITSTTDSSGYATGALIVSGGAGIAKNLSVGQNIAAVGNITTAGGTVNAAAVQVSGQNVWHTGNFNPANYVQQSGGVVNGNLGLTGALNGGSSGLTINAGAIDQSLVLDADGAGRVEVRDTLAVTNATGIQHLLMGNQDTAGLNNPAILRAANGAFEFGRGNSWTGQGGTFTPSVSITNSGNVGIGTIAPEVPLHVARSATDGVAGGTASSYEIAQFKVHAGGGIKRGLEIGAPTGNVTSPVYLKVHGTGNRFALLNQSNDEQLTVLSSGNVGVGMPAPAFPLHVFSSSSNTVARFESANPGANLRFKSSTTTNEPYVGVSGNSWNIGHVSGGEQITVVENGDFGIGTTTPTAKLDVAGSGRVGGDLDVTANAAVGGNAVVTGQTTTGNLLTTTSASVGTNLTVGGYAVVSGQTTTGNLVTTTLASVGTNLTVGGAASVAGQATFSGNVGVGTASPFMKLQVSDGNLAVTGTNGGIIHLANGYSDGGWGVRVAGLDNGTNGHDLAVLTRATAAGAFQQSFTVKSDGTTAVSGNLRMLSAAGAWWGFANDGGSFSVFRETTTGGGRTAVATFGLDNNVAFSGRISVAAPSGASDAATKGYVDDNNPWNWDLGDVTLKDPNDWLGLGVVSPSAPLHVQTSALFGEIARFGAGGQFWNLNLRSYLTLQNQNPSYWWEFSVQDETGAGAQNGFALRAKHAEEGVSKPRLYVNPGLPVPASQRSFMRLYNQNPASGWEFSVEGIAGDGAGNGLALREYAQSVTGSPALYIAENTGHIGLGTTQPGAYRLAVNGSIRTREIVVENTGWADYVFADGYALTPLAEVEAHIKEKKHLPGVPSAAEVAEHGVKIGEMQTTLLAKVEELTLHLIAQQKEIATLRQQVAELQATTQR
ncbi:MAG: beta strand repeat-containing protein [Verrucomicrobiota bacterium]